MSLMERISQDMTAAMRAREQQRLGALRMAKAALMNREVEKGRALEEGEEQQVMIALIKQRRDSIEQFKKGGPRGSRGQGSGRDRDARRLPPAARGSGGDRARGDRGHCRNRRDLGQGPREGDEGGDAEARRTGGRRQDDQRVVRKKLGA